MTPPLAPPQLESAIREGNIIIYVDGMQVLAPMECIYIPYFAREDKVV